MTIDSDNYVSFRQNLEYLIEDANIENQEQLSFLMAQRGFRKNKYGKRFYPSQKQLNIAWDYVKTQGKWQEVTEKPIKHKVNIAKKKRQKDNFITVKSFSYKRGDKTIRVKSYKRRYRNV